MGASTLAVSFCTLTNAPHGVIAPVEDVFWKSHREHLRLSVWDVPMRSWGKRALSPVLAFENAVLPVWFLGGLPSPGCRNITDGQLDIHDAAFWCHPHATYASPCGYDFLEIAFSQSLTAVTMATQSQLLGKDFSMHTHTETQAHTLELKPSWSPKSPHAKHSKATVWV